MTSVWPALWPPWKRTTMSACSDSQSTILPFPSSPHWAPTTTTLAMRGHFLLQRRIKAHDLPRENRRPAAFLEVERPDQPPALRARGIDRRSAEGADTRIKEAGRRRKQERGFSGLPGRLQAFDIPVKFMSAKWRRS